MHEVRQRIRAFERIEHNILQHGWHVYVIAGGADPRFAYTIGLTPSCRREIILAGAAYYSNEDAVEIVNEVAKRLKSGSLPDRLELDGLGSFSFRNVDKSWSTQLLLGALDFYSLDEIDALQIVPDRGHWTLDIPNLSRPWNASVEPAWRWLEEEWKYDVSPQSNAVTNLDALRGASVTEATRWEEDEWELFAGVGPDVPKDEIRMVPLATMVALDPSLEPVVYLLVESAMWREPNEEWHPWKTAGG